MKNINKLLSGYIIYYHTLQYYVVGGTHQKIEIFLKKIQNNHPIQLHK